MANDIATRELRNPIDIAEYSSVNSTRLESVQCMVYLAIYQNVAFIGYPADGYA
ncbi:hypothetical protein EYZ11_001492 [Aspergillus tanneri]|uniref:Uncharacterized protein n=1 Tax=Aspergillus tanneri TaxID=1220188 RepID=A0A4S3JUG3_9EURO|nr:hypothetical protein EYZ11_001492 [Aspergillus tanneri]